MQNIVGETNIVLQKKDNIVLHFSYDDNLTLRELSDVLDLTNKAINQFNKENGVKSNSKLGKDYAPEVMAVMQGSVVLEMGISLVASVSISILANYLYDKLKELGASKKQIEEQKYKYPISITVNGDNNKNINIHIHNQE